MADRVLALVLQSGVLMKCTHKGAGHRGMHEAALICGELDC